MPTTPKLGIPYPVLADPADVPTDTGELATRVDTVAGAANGLATLGADGKVPSAQLPPAPGAIPPAIVDAKGDLIAASGPDVVARLPVGTDGQILIVDAAAPLGVKWATPAAGAIPATLLDAKGDLIAASANDTPARLPVGLDGQILVVDSTQATGVKWGTPAAASGIPAGIVDAKGDLIAASANDTPARLAVGSNGQVLVADSTQPLGVKWAPAPSGLPDPVGHEGQWLKSVSGAAVWTDQYDVPLATVTAKGDLIVATASGVVARLPVGANGFRPKADSTQAGGIKWDAPAIMQFVNVAGVNTDLGITPHEKTTLQIYPNGGGSVRSAAIPPANVGARLTIMNFSPSPVTLKHGGTGMPGGYAALTHTPFADVILPANVGAAVEYEFDGTLWRQVASAGLAAAAAGATLVTALPGSPTDGQEVVLVDSLTAPTWSWHLRYIAAKASNRWVFVGGSALFAEVPTSEAATLAAYGNLATVGPSIAVPLAGVYEVSIGCHVPSITTSGTSAFMSYDIGGTAAADADAVVQIAPSGSRGGVGVITRQKTLATALSLVAKYKAANATTWEKRWMRAAPIAVGG